MNQNNNKNNQNGKGNNNGNNWRGVLSLVSWALLLTIVISYAGTYMNSTSQNASSVEIKYSEFISLVKQDKVSSVKFDDTNDLVVITPVKGFTYKDDNGKTYDGDLQLYTVKIDNDTLLPLLNEHNVTYDAGPYKHQLSPFMSILVSTILPFLIIMQKKEAANMMVKERLLRSRYHTEWGASPALQTVPGAPCGIAGNAAVTPTRNRRSAAWVNSRDSTPSAVA